MKTVRIVWRLNGGERGYSFDALPMEFSGCETKLEVEARMERLAQLEFERAVWPVIVDESRTADAVMKMLDEEEGK